MMNMHRLSRIATLLTVTFCLAATPLWGAVTLKGPTKPLNPNGSMVNIQVLFSGETGASATVTAEITSNQTGMVTNLVGNNTSVSLKNGKGTGRVSFRVTKNATGLPRSATLSINGTSITINQNGTPCKVTILPPKSNMEFFGGTGSFSVLVPEGCEWSANETAPWINLDSANGTGPGQVIFSVAENDGKPRSDKILVTSSDPVSKSPQATKVHTVSQKEQKLTSSSKVGPLTPLDTPDKAVKAYRTTLNAAETIFMLNDLLGAFGDVGIFANPSKKQSVGVTPLKPVQSAKKLLHPVMVQTRKVLESATDISTDLCSSGTALVEGLTFDPVSGEVVAVASTVKIIFTDCVVEEETINGIITAKGVTINQDSGKIAGEITIGKSMKEPLRITSQYMNLTSFFILKLAFMTKDGPTTASIQANGFIDEDFTEFRALVEMKGIKLTANSSETGPGDVSVNGTVRETIFLDGIFETSREVRMHDFVETATVQSGPDSEVLNLTINGMFGQTTTPADTCSDGNFDITTIESLKFWDQEDGTLVINGAAIMINNDDSITVTAGGQTATYTWEQIWEVCGLQALKPAGGLPWK
jgi:hypothetical protein